MADIAGVTSNSAASAALGASAAGAAGQNLAGKDTFLKLLVAQIKNQNPLNPADGVQFVSQLAQFSELEQIMSIRSDLAAIHNEMQTPTADKPQGTSPKGSA